MNINKGDIVARKSYGKDIIFVVEKIIKSKNEEHIAILKGVIIRIKADAPVGDLEYVSKECLEEALKKMDELIRTRVEHNRYPGKKIGNKFLKRYKEIIYTGRILHLDGDRRYTDKSIKYYKDLGLTAVVKNIPEYKQASIVQRLLQHYKPDILIITGHDSMIKMGTDYNNIYNYRNSRHFVNAVKEARKWGRTSDELVIFAGACQSYFEALMLAGADFASSPGRILIDFLDPLIVAEKIATTDVDKYVSVSSIVSEVKEGAKGIGGTGANGKKRVYWRQNMQNITFL